MVLRNWRTTATASVQVTIVSFTVLRTTCSSCWSFEFGIARMCIAGSRLNRFFVPWMNSVDAAGGGPDFRRQEREQGMVEPNRKKWAWGLPLTWGLLVAALWWPYAEVLTGWGTTRYALWVLFHVVWSGLATVLLVRLRQRSTALLLFAVGVFLGIPMPSMAGVDFRLSNATADDIEVLIWRTDAPSRHRTVLVPNGQTVRLRTAPGDWPAEAGLTLRAGKAELEDDLSSFRSTTVTIGKDKITKEKS